MKKGQVTLFIIAGIVIVFLISFYYYSANRQKTKEIETESIVNIKEITPLKFYIEHTAQELMIEGLFLLGSQGGRLYVSTWPDCKQESPAYTESIRFCNQSGIYDFSYPEYLDSSPYRHQRIGVGINDSREGSSDQFTQDHLNNPGIVMAQPYAYPHFSPYTLATHYVYGYNQPLPPMNSNAGPHSIEMQLANWTATHLRSMLNFSDFEDRDYDIEIADDYPYVNVSINEEEITVTMYWRLNVEKSDIVYTPHEFHFEIDYPFKRFYSYANEVIQRDMYTLEKIDSWPMLDEGEEISEFLINESEPDNYEYDVITITDTSFDWEVRYNHGIKNYEFMFIRENRAPDADTVYPDPDIHYLNEQVVWNCPNFQVGGGYLDPDEDDEYTDEFPFISNNPQWYVFWSKGDALYYSDAGSCGGLAMVPNLAKKVVFPAGDGGEGATYIGLLEECGNLKQKVPITPTDPADVGDTIVVTVGDSMDFPVMYPDRSLHLSPAEGPGTGRLNDRKVFHAPRPVRCRPSDGEQGCCVNGYWAIGKVCQHKGTQIRCNKCTTVTPPCYQVPPTYETICPSPYQICYPEDQVEIYSVCNHRGECVWSDQIAS